MCTVLQQHLNNAALGVQASSSSGPSATSYRPPVNAFESRPTFSYLSETIPSLRRPVDPYDLKSVQRQQHFHVPPHLDQAGRRGRKGYDENAYISQLMGRRARSHSRSAMRAMAARMREEARPRPPRSPHMNNEEALASAQYPDGRVPRDPSSGSSLGRRRRKRRPIERDDFPAPPFAYWRRPQSRGRSRQRRSKKRALSAPAQRSGMTIMEDNKQQEEDEALKPMDGVAKREFDQVYDDDSFDDDDDDDYSSYDDDLEADEGGDRSVHEEGETESTSSDKENDVAETTKLDRREEELRKLEKAGASMSTVFLKELASERERRKLMKSKPMDPRSAARTPAAKFEPHFRLRYDSPINASPSRIADHLLPWDDDETFREGGRDSSLTGGHMSRRSMGTPFLPGTSRATTRSSSASAMRAVSPIRPGYSTSPAPMTSAPKSYVLPSSQIPRRYTSTPMQDYETSDDELMNKDSSAAETLYPLHLLQTSNYRLPGDVDRCNLERHLGDDEFEAVFKMARHEFYDLPYWRRCELKRRWQLF